MGAEQSNKFLELFEGSDIARGVFNVVEDGSSGKKKGHARVLREPANEGLWKEHLEGGSGLGVIPINTLNKVKWGAIDIDQYNLDHKALVKKLKKAGVPAVLTRSKSGGGHVFLFVQEWIEAAEMQEKLNDLAVFLNVSGSEIFPKQSEILADRGDTGNFLNMPYFAGDATTRYGFDENGNALEVEEFLEHTLSRQLSVKQFRAIKIEREKAKGMEDAPPCLEHLCAVGFGEGSRNNGLFNMAVLAKQMDDLNWENLTHQFNTEYMDPPLPENEVNFLIKQLEKKGTYFYKCNDQPINSVCDKAKCRIRKYGVGRGIEDEFANLVEVKGIEPTYYMDINGQRVWIPSADDLLSYRRIEKQAVTQIGVLVKTMKQQDWRERLAELMETRTVADETPEHLRTRRGLMANRLRLIVCGHVIFPLGLYKLPVAVRHPFYDEENNTIGISQDLLWSIISNPNAPKELRDAFPVPSSIPAVITEMGGQAADMVSEGGAGMKISVWCVPLGELGLTPPDLRLAVTDAIEDVPPMTYLGTENLSEIN